MLDEFLAWWSARWREILPEQLLAAASASVPSLLLRPDRLDAPTALSVRLRGRGAAEMPLGSLTVSSGADRRLAALMAGRRAPPMTVLELPAGLVLTREVSLPYAAEADLDRVLQYEMDRLTPFSASEILHAHDVRSRDRAAGKLAVRLSLVPLVRVSQALETLGLAGVGPHALEGVDGFGQVRRIPLGAHGARRRRDAVRHAAWAVAAGLLAVVLAAPFARQSALMASADARLASLRPPLRQAEALRTTILAAAAGSGVFAEAAGRTADPLAVLATVTRSLPDDTYLTDLSLNGRNVTLNGQSASAAKLIGLLAADPTIDNPAFSAPVTRLEATHTDLFSIRAEVVPPVVLPVQSAQPAPGAGGKTVR